MTILIITIIVGLIWYYNKIGFNPGAIIGGVIGIIIGSSIGIAGGGDAVNGVVIFGAIGFFIGGLIFKNWQNSNN
jgi:hypothetical protein